MSKQSKILVTGAGGTVGGEVAVALADRRPRLAFRSPAKAEKAKSEGHDVVVVDYAQPETLPPAMDGIEAVFLLGAGARGQEEGESAVVQAAERAGVRKIVKLSVWGASAEAYSFAKIHRPIERAIERTGLAFTFLRPNGFMQNFANHMAGSIRGAGAIFQPAGDATIGHIDVRDIAAVAAVALTSSRLDGKALELSGPADISYGEAAETLSKVLGKSVRYVAVSDADAKAAMVEHQMPEFYADHLIDLYRYYREGGGSGVSRAVEEVTGRSPISFEKFVNDHAARFR